MTSQLVECVRRRLPRCGRDRATRITSVVLRALGERLPAGEAALLAAALPPSLGADVRHSGPPSTWDGPRDGRPLGRIALRCGTDEETALVYARAVVDTVAHVVPDGVLYRVQLALPDELRAWFPVPLAAVPPRTGPPRRSSDSWTTSATGMSSTNDTWWSQPEPPPRSG